MSLIQSPSTSASARIRYDVGTLPYESACSIMPAPFMNQISTSPVALFRHKRSARESPSMSPTALIDHEESAPMLAGKLTLWMVSKPSMFQIATCPEEGSNHTTSLIELPLTSPVAIAVHELATPIGKCGM